MPTSESPPMLAPASWFFQELVLPNYREFLGDQLCRRRAYNAAVSIAHMPDHIVIRGGGVKGQVGNLRSTFRKQNQAFLQVDDMCNAFKHVKATGGGSVYPVTMTSTGVSIAEPESILFTSPINGESYIFRALEPILVCNFNDHGDIRKFLVGWALYGAIRFVASASDCDDQILGSDKPNLADLIRGATVPS